MPTAHIW